MPASVADPIETQLRLSLSTEQDGDGDISKRLAASCSRALTTHIDYEQAPSYQPKALNGLKNKCIILKSNNLPTPSTTNASPESVESPTNGVKASSDSVLPTPKLILFPPELIQLGWQARYRVHTGMINVGNSCYLNASLQALFHVPSLVNWLHGDKQHRDQCYIPNGATSECIICAMAKTLESTQEKYNNITKPNLIISKLKLIGRSLQHGQQEDAHEFMRLLLECMEKSFLTRFRGHKLDSYSKETTPLNQIFGGYIRTEVQCKRCMAISTTFQHFQDLQLDIQRVSSVAEALRTYFSLETLDRADYSCKKCGKEVSATKRFYVERPPPVLFLQLKRFNAQGFKMTKGVSVPAQLDLGPYLRQRSNGNLHYRLTSVVNHSGSGAQCGHYTAIGRTSTNQLYTFDDNRVTPLGSIASCESNVYVIIYEQVQSGGNPQTPVPLAATVPRSPFGILAHRPSLLNNKVSPTIIPVSHKPLEVRQSPLAIPNHKFTPMVIASPKKAIVSCSPINGHHRTSTSVNGASPVKANEVINGHKKDSTPIKSSGCVNSTNGVISPTKARSRDVTPSKEKTSATNGHSAVKPPLNGLVPYEQDSSSSDSFTGTSTPRLNGERRVSNATSSKSGERRVNDSTGVGWSVTERSRSTSAELEEGEIRRENKHKLKRRHESETANDERVPSINSTPRQALNDSSVSHSNGTGRDRQPEIAAAGFYEKSRQQDKAQNHDHGGSKHPQSPQKTFHRPNWDNRVDASRYLKSQSHRGLGGNVNSWSGGRSHVDREAGNDFRDRKRVEDRSYDEDYDRGRSKKPKPSAYWDNHSYQDTFPGPWNWKRVNSWSKDKDKNKHRNWGKDRKNRPRGHWNR